MKENKTHISNLTDHQSKHPDLMRRIWGIAFDLEDELYGAILKDSEELRKLDFYEVKAIFDVSGGLGKKYLIVHHRKSNGEYLFKEIHYSDYDEVLKVTAAFGIYHGITLGSRPR